MLKLINDNTEIDTGYISCVEYQLFINEKIKVGEYHQPDHWKLLKHAPEDADKPITGVRASDAEAFCAWLTQRETRPGYKYRLPTLDEVKSNPCPINHIGCWCIYEGKHIIGGIEPQQWQVWQNELVDLCNFDSALGCNSGLNLDFSFNPDLTLHLDFPKLHLQILVLSQEFVRDYAHELNLINKLTRNYKYLSTRARSWITITTYILRSIFALIRNITTPLVNFLVFLFRDIVFRIIYALFSALAHILAPVFRVIRNIITFIAGVLIFLKNIVFRCIRAVFAALAHMFTAIFEYIYNLFLSAIQTRKKGYSSDGSPDQILKHARARAAEFERVYSLALSLKQSNIRTNSRSRIKGSNRDTTSAFALLLSIERDYLDSFHEKFTKRSSNFSRTSSLKFLFSLKNDLNSVIDFDKVLDSAFTCAINRELNFDRRNLYSICRYLLIITIFYALLSRDYRKEFKNRELLQYQDFNRSRCQQLGEKYQLRSNEVFKLYAIFLLITKRYEREIVVWEGIRIVRERIED